MHYLLSVVADTTDLATPTEMAAIDVFNERLRAEGHWVLAAGLQPPTAATVIDNRSGKTIVTDGPFAETKEFIAGFWIIDAPDHDTALKLCAEGSKHCNRQVEIRAFLDDRPELWRLVK
jgi:hypothetical protein